MEARHRHTPPASSRARCPVCEQAVYSTSGIHPQCAMKRNEAPRPKAPPRPPAPADADGRPPEAAATSPTPRPGGLLTSS